MECQGEAAQVVTLGVAVADQVEITCNGLHSTFQHNRGNGTCGATPASLDGIQVYILITGQIDNSLAVFCNSYINLCGFATV